MNFTSDYNKERRAIDLPSQMVSTKTKQNKKWQEDTIDYFISSIYTTNDNIRKSKEEMRANIRMFNGNPNAEDLRESFDPLGLNDDNENNENLHLKGKFYNIINNPLKTLFGEELKRRSDIRAIVVNQNAINEKDEAFTEKLFSYLQEQAQAESTDEEDFKKNLSELDRFNKYDLQSSHEKMVNEIIQVLSNNRELNIKRKFNTGFESLNIIAEEVLRVGSKGNEPWLFNVDSENFHVLGLGDSKYIQHGNAWIEVEYMTVNRVIEEFNRKLTDKQIKSLLDEGNDNLYINHITPITASTIGTDGNIIIGEGFNSVSQNGNFFTLDGESANDDNWINDAGDIRVARLQFLSLRKIGELTYYDEEGAPQKMFVDEYFKPDETLGQEVEWFWINELMIGEKIGKDIYFMEVSPVQMRSLINPAMVRPSYVGVINSTMGGKARCIVDDVKPYQEDFNTWMLKLKNLWTQHVGKIAVLDVSSIPSWMEVEEWFSWLRKFGIAFKNPFEESNKGQLSGNMNQNSQAIDLSQAEEINNAIQMLSWLEQMVYKIAAVPESRQGQLQGNEGLGVTQEANVRATTQTESLFQLHEDIKAFSYELLVEFTKVLWKDEKSKRQYQLDDLSNYIIDIDGAVLNEAEYGIQITNSSRLYEMETMLKQLSHAGMQNGTVTLSDVARMQIATSPSEMLATLEQSEEKRIKQQQQSEEMKIQAQQQQQQVMMQFEQMKHQMELEKMKVEYGYKMEMQKMMLADKANQDAFNQYYTDQNRNGVEDQVEIDTENIRRESVQDKIAAEKEMLDKELKSKEKIEADKLKNAVEIARINAMQKQKSNNK